jgi:hypothetical protein
MTRIVRRSADIDDELRGLVRESGRGLPGRGHAQTCASRTPSARPRRSSRSPASAACPARSCGGKPAVDAIATAVAASGLSAVFLPFILGIAGNIVTCWRTGRRDHRRLDDGRRDRRRLHRRADDGHARAPSRGDHARRRSGSVVVKYVNSSYFRVHVAFSRRLFRSALIRTAV